MLTYAAAFTDVIKLVLDMKKVNISSIRGTQNHLSHIESGQFHRIKPCFKEFNWHILKTF